MVFSGLVGGGELHTKKKLFSIPAWCSHNRAGGAGVEMEFYYNFAVPPLLLSTFQYILAIYSFSPDAILKQGERDGNKFITLLTINFNKSVYANDTDFFFQKGFYKAHHKWRLGIFC